MDQSTEQKHSTDVESSPQAQMEQAEAPAAQVEDAAVASDQPSDPVAVVVDNSGTTAPDPNPEISSQAPSKAPDATNDPEVPQPGVSEDLGPEGAPADGASAPAAPELTNEPVGEKPTESMSALEEALPKSPDSVSRPSGEMHSEPKQGEGSPPPVDPAPTMSENTVSGQAAVSSQADSDALPQESAPAEPAGDESGSGAAAADSPAAPTVAADETEVDTGSSEPPPAPKAIDTEVSVDTDAIGEADEAKIDAGVGEPPSKAMNTANDAGTTDEADEAKVDTGACEPPPAPKALGSGVSADPGPTSGAGTGATEPSPAPKALGSGVPADADTTDEADEAKVDTGATEPSPAPEALDPASADAGTTDEADEAKVDTGATKPHPAPEVTGSDISAGDIAGEAKVDTGATEPPPALRSDVSADGGTTEEADETKVDTGASEPPPAPKALGSGVSADTDTAGPLPIPKAMGSGVGLVSEDDRSEEALRRKAAEEGSDNDSDGEVEYGEGGPSEQATAQAYKPRPTDFVPVQAQAAGQTDADQPASPASAESEPEPEVSAAVDTDPAPGPSSDALGTDEEEDNEDGWEKDEADVRLLKEHEYRIQEQVIVEQDGLAGDDAPAVRGVPDVVDDYRAVDDARDSFVDEDKVEADKMEGAELVQYVGRAMSKHAEMARSSYSAGHHAGAMVSVRHYWDVKRLGRFVQRALAPEEPKLGRMRLLEVQESVENVTPSSEVKHDAALVIGSAVRRHVFRRRAAVLVQCAFRVHAAAWAVRRLQAEILVKHAKQTVQRGKDRALLGKQQSRPWFRELRLCLAEVHNTSVYRRAMDLLEEALLTQLREVSSTIITSLVKGFLCRKGRNITHLMRLKKLANSQLLAATRLQRVVRGHHGRNEARRVSERQHRLALRKRLVAMPAGWHNGVLDRVRLDLRRQKAAALLLQSAFRGHKVRRHAMRKLKHHLKQQSQHQKPQRWWMDTADEGNRARTSIFRHHDSAIAHARASPADRLRRTVEHHLPWANTEWAMAVTNDEEAESEGEEDNSDAEKEEGPRVIGRYGAELLPSSQAAPSSPPHTAAPSTSLPKTPDSVQAVHGSSKNSVVQRPDSADRLRAIFSPEDVAAKLRPTSSGSRPLSGNRPASGSSGSGSGSVVGGHDTLGSARPLSRESGDRPTTSGSVPSSVRVSRDPLGPSPAARPRSRESGERPTSSGSANEIYVVSDDGARPTSSGTVDIQLDHDRELYFGEKPLEDLDRRWQPRESTLSQVSKPRAKSQQGRHGSPKFNVDVGAASVQKQICPAYLQPVIQATAPSPRHARQLQAFALSPVSPPRSFMHHMRLNGPPSRQPPPRKSPKRKFGKAHLVSRSHTPDSLRALLRPKAVKMSAVPKIEAEQQIAWRETDADDGGDVWEQSWGQAGDGGVATDRVAAVVDAVETFNWKDAISFRTSTGLPSLPGPERLGTARASSARSMSSEGGRSSRGSRSGRATTMLGKVVMSPNLLATPPQEWRRPPTADAWFPRATNAKERKMAEKGYLPAQLGASCVKQSQAERDFLYLLQNKGPPTLRDLPDEEYSKGSGHGSSRGIEGPQGATAAPRIATVSSDMILPRPSARNFMHSR